MEDTASSPDDGPQYPCPNCGEAVSAPESGEGLVQCPRCGEQFFIPGDAPDDASENDEAAEARDRAELEAQREQELSEMRIQQVSDLRRAAYRSRSWLIIGAITCIVGAAQLVYLAIRGYRNGLRLTPLVDMLLAVAALLICAYLFRRIRILSREIRQTTLHDPSTPPDFSTLSDGSQQWRNLDSMTSEQDPQ